MKYIVTAASIIIALICSLYALVDNTVGLRATLQNNVINYANNLSEQLTNNISYRLHVQGYYIRNLADSFSRVPRSLLTEELMVRKAQYMKLEDLFVVKADGATIPPDRANTWGYLSGYPELYAKPKIFFGTGDDILFSAPIIYKNGENGVLVGRCSIALIQRILQEVDFQNQGVCCIVDSAGTIVIPAKDEMPLIGLKDILAKSVAEKVLSASDGMDGKTGEYRFGLARIDIDDDREKQLLVGYDSLGINDWILLTLITADSPNETAIPYIRQYVVIISVLCLLMVVSFLSIIGYYCHMMKNIQVAASRDPLTGGYNELGFWENSEKLLRRHPARGFAIIYLNIRNFKNFNKCFGISQGDSLLRQLHNFLEKSLRKEELLCRSGGDHFFLLLESADEQAARQRMHDMLLKLKHRLSGNFNYDHFCFDLGGYFIREKNSDLRLLLDRAKVASAYSQEYGVCRFYDEALSKKIEKEQKLEADFPKAVRLREFQLYIQPKFCPGQQDAGGGEVLCRWNHPELGLLFPGDFIPLFERSEKICELDFYVFEETCKLLRTWLAQGRKTSLSVNLSRAHLFSGSLSFLDRLQALKNEYGIPDGILEVELTESLMLEHRDLPLVISMINRIREMGFLCAIDDFGFGYSSLALLKDLDVTAVKLDRKFFLNTNQKSWLVVEHLIQLAHRLGMQVVAEGVEENHQVAQLHRLGCDLIQGYVYAKPMPSPDFEEKFIKSSTRG